MVNCPKCGKDNAADALYCTTCGALLELQNGGRGVEQRAEEFTREVQKRRKKAGKKMEQAAVSFASEMEQIGKSVGRRAEDAGKTFEKHMRQLGERVDDAGKRVEYHIDRSSRGLDSWFDRTFGFFGPLVSSFIGLIIVRLIIEALKVSADTNPVSGDVASALHSYLLLIFAMILLSSYNSYLLKKYKPFRWVAPIAIAVVIVVLSWVVAHIVSVAGTGGGVPELSIAVPNTEKYLPMIFTIVLLLGYLVVVATVAWEKDHQ